MTAPRLRIGNAAAQLAQRQRHDLERRRAGAATILTPTAIAGDVSAARLLYTTLNGQARPITQADLAVFRQHVAEVGRRMRAGITAQEAINLSRPIDRERANKEIRYAAPTFVRNGLVRFLTDAGPNSKVIRHHTGIEFVEWAAAVARPGTPLQAATWLCHEGKLRMECQCEAFTFWGFRYIATIGGFVLGRKESGYPKVRQPTLAGCACKHLLRTLQTVQQDMLVRRRVADAVAAERRLLDRPSSSTAAPIVRFTQADADKITAGRVRRISVTPPMRTGLPNAAGVEHIKAALRSFERRTDKNAAVIVRALQELLKQSTR